MRRERQVAHYHGATSVRAMTSHKVLSEVDVQWVLSRSLQFYFSTMKIAGMNNKKLSEMRSGPELGWI